jgi:alpha-D-ribose 1-methylphosphonate 5-triphosphate synthase subunit PhnG
MTSVPVDTAERSRWMSILAKSRWADLERHWHDAADEPVFTYLRAPETGLVMVRGRMGGSGGPFNMGEATVTRCAVRLDNEIVGHAYVMGRNADHARVAALCDALMQDESRRECIDGAVIAPLAALLDERRDETAREAAATKVDFFTLVRGED